MYDAAGNPSNTVTYSGIDQDTVAPRATVSINCPGESAVASPAGSNYWQTDWYNIASAAVMTVAAIDATPSSGLPVNPVTYTFPDGANELSQAVTVYDEAGNSVTVASGYYSGIYQDTMAVLWRDQQPERIHRMVQQSQWAGGSHLHRQRPQPHLGNRRSEYGRCGVLALPVYVHVLGRKKSVPFAICLRRGREPVEHRHRRRHPEHGVPTVTSVSIGIPGTSPVSTPAGNSYWQTDWYNIASGAAVITVTVGDNVPTRAARQSDDTRSPTGRTVPSPAITIYDKAGNSVTVPAGYFTGIYQDTTARTITTVSIAIPPAIPFRPAPATIGKTTGTSMASRR